MSYVVVKTAYRRLLLTTPQSIELVALSDFYNHDIMNKNYTITMTPKPYIYTKQILILNQLKLN